MQRRKFLIGMGALAAGSGATMGTGAFTSASVPERQMNVAIDSDLNSQIALVPGDDPDASTEDGQLTLDLTGGDGEGTNINSVYTWGDHDNPSSSHAFKLVNNDEQAYRSVKFTYALDDDSWVDNTTTYDNESFLKFTTYGSGDPDGYWGSVKCPNNQLGTPNPVSREMTTSGPVSLEVGQEVYVVVEIDSTGVDATVDDDLSGDLSIDISNPQTQ